MWSYHEATVDDPHDPEAAKKLLEEAGVSGLKMKIWAMPVQRPYNPNARRMAELIQADFAAIGVEVEIVSMEWGEYLKQSSAVDRDGAVLLGWTGDNGDPDNFLAVLLGCDAVGGNNRAAVVPPAFRRSASRRRRAPPTRRPAPTSTNRRRRSSRNRHLGDDRPFAADRADEQQGERFRPGSARPLQFREGRHRRVAGAA